MRRILMLAAVIGVNWGAAAQTAGGPSSGPGPMPTQTPLGGGANTPPPTAADAGATTTAATPTQPRRVIQPPAPAQK